jgi:TRAP-type C4-dicarboxylate transport system permease small subunit
MLRINQWLESLIAHCLAIIMASTVLTVLWQVFSRYILQSPSSVSEEVSRFLLIWLGILGAAYCYQRDSHLSLDLLSNKLSPKGKNKLAVFVHIIVFIFSFMTLIIGGLNLMTTTLDPVQTSAILGVKVAYVYSIVPLVGLFFCFTALTKIITAFSQLSTKQQGEQHGV